MRQRGGVSHGQLLTRRPPIMSEKKAVTCGRLATPAVLSLVLVLLASLSQSCASSPAPCHQELTTIQGELKHLLLGINQLKGMLSDSWGTLKQIAEALDKSRAEEGRAGHYNVTGLDVATSGATVVEVVTMGATPAQHTSKVEQEGTAGQPHVIPTPDQHTFVEELEGSAGKLRVTRDGSLEYDDETSLEVDENGSGDEQGSGKFPSDDSELKSWRF